MNPFPDQTKANAIVMGIYPHAKIEVESHLLVVEQSDAHSNTYFFSATYRVRNLPHSFAKALAEVFAKKAKNPTIAFQPIESHDNCFYIVMQANSYDRNWHPSFCLPPFGVMDPIDSFDSYVRGLEDFVRAFRLTTERPVKG